MSANPYLVQSGDFASGLPGNSRVSIRTIVERVKAERVAQPSTTAILIEEPTPAKPARKTPVKQKGAGLRPAPDPQSITQNYDRSKFARVEKAIADCPGLSFEATGIYTFLASHAYGEKDQVWVGVDTIATRGAITRTTAIKYLDELIAWGLIERKRRGVKKVNVYRLIYRT